MPTNWFQGDLTKLSDGELRELAAEIDDARPGDWSDWPYDSWEFQAGQQAFAIRNEFDRRWRETNPEAAAERDRKYRDGIGKVLAAQIDAVRPQLMETFNRSNVFSRLIRRA